VTVPPPPPPVVVPETAPVPVPVPAPPMVSEPEPMPAALPALGPDTALADASEGDFWFGTVMDLVKRELVAALVRELALQSQLLRREGGTWQLRVDRETLNQAGARDRLQTALAAAGHAVTLQVSTGPVSDSAARRLAAQAAARQLEAEAAIADDPFVQQMMREFGGKIVPGSVRPL